MQKKIWHGFYHLTQIYDKYVANRPQWRRFSPLHQTQNLPASTSEDPQHSTHRQMCIHS